MQSFRMCSHTRFRLHLNPSPLHIISSLPSSLPMPNPEAKSNPSKRLPSASLASLRYIRGLSIGVDSGFNPHPVSVFFLPHEGDISSFVHLLPPNSTVDKNAPSPLVVFCANSNANANVNNVLFMAAFKSIRSIPYLLNDCSFSLPLGCARSDTTFYAAILLQARRNLITQKNEEILFKSADNSSTHVMDAQGRSGEVIDLVEGQI